MPEYGTELYYILHLKNNRPMRGKYARALRRTMRRIDLAFEVDRKGFRFMYQWE